MPSLSASTNVDRSRLAPATPAAAPSSGPTSILPDPSTQRSPFMHAAMPTSASTYDSLTRQFYGSGVPQTRILSPTGGK